MPFAMTHLIVANKVANFLNVNSIEDFLLGSVAPDAVHFMDNYHSSLKKESHLCVGDEPWGMLTNNKEWTENVLLFRNIHLNTDNIDFIKGYVTHILTDIQNNIKIWTPFRTSSDAKKNAKLYHQESCLVDYEQYDNMINKEIIHKLALSEPYAVDGIVSKDSVLKLKHDILNNRYINRIELDIDKKKYVNHDITNKFIEDVVMFIKEIY